MPFPPPPPRTRQPLSGALSGGLQAMLWLVAGLYALTSLLTVALNNVSRDYLAQPDGPEAAAALDRWIAWEDAVTAVQGVVTVISLALLVVLIVWSFKAHRAADALEAGGRAFGRGWLVGGWFIPVGSLFVPKLAMNEIERVARAERVGGRVVGDSWRFGKVHPLGTLWWASLVGGFMLSRIGNVVADGIGTDLDRAETAYLLVATGHAALAISGLLGALHFRLLSGHLSAESLGAG